ncbi:hypothetical protein BGZ57DRAFT_927107 [Hyaloscypha finlandica]|nr:hypothetical protein BGZ57DRAFT_927107 [Hyaloscypha finlandica]
MTFPISLSSPQLSSGFQCYLLHLTLVSITALLLTSFPCIAAIDSINAPSSVKAGTDFVVSVNPGPEKPAFSGDHFTAYRVYLAIAPPEKIKRSLEPVCYLAISSTVSSTEFAVQIPADIGPSGPDSLAIATRRFNERGDKSDISQKFYPETKNATTIEEYHNTYSCWLACPGTTYKSWDDFLEAYWKRINGTFPGSDDGGRHMQFNLEEYISDEVGNYDYRFKCPDDFNINKLSSQND